jgi:mannose-6-phosphate isomerase-like protein (cupin superfamily)
MISLKEPVLAKRVFVNPIYKDKATVLKTSAETHGKFLLGELEVAPGGGNSLHMHSAFTETFIAVKGTLGVRFNKRKMYLRPGDSLTVPVNTPHCFFNSSNETVVCHVKLEPAHEGFIKGIAIGYGLASDGMTNKKGFPKSLTHLALLISLTDTRPYGPIGLLMPLFNWLAKRARKKGVEEALLRKYYYQAAAVSGSGR